MRLRTHFRWTKAQLNELPLEEYQELKAYWVVEPFGAIFDDFMSSRTAAVILNQLFRVANPKTTKVVKAVDLMHEYKPPFTNEEINQNILNEFMAYGRIKQRGV